MFGLSGDQLAIVLCVVGVLLAAPVAVVETLLVGVIREHLTLAITHTTHTVHGADSKDTATNITVSGAGVDVDRNIAGVV